MKKFVYLWVLFCAALMSCTESADMQEDLNSENSDFCSSDDLYFKGAYEFFGWLPSYERIEPMSRSSVNEITLNSYTSISSGGNQKVLVLKDLADVIGVSSQIYILEYVTAYQDITISGLGTTAFFSSVDSPLCGVVPNGKNWGEIGYSSSTPDANGNIRLASKCIHIISDLSGRNYDLWYPRRPENFQWIYNLVTL